MRSIPPATRISIPVALMGMAIALTLVVAVLSGAAGWLLLAGLALCLLAGALAVWTHHQALRMQRCATGHVDAAAEAELHYFEVLRNVVRMVESHSPATAGRSERMGRLTRQVAGRLNLAPGRVELLGLAAEVHDVGMLAVPEHILEKTGLLQRDDCRAIKEHPQIGHQVLQPLTFLRDVLEAVLYHHERLNGTGYPHGRSGEQIPLEARIFAVVETFEALTHDRPWRPALSGAQAVRELARCAGEGYDQRCVRALAEAVNLVHCIEPESPPRPSPKRRAPAVSA